MQLNVYHLKGRTFFIIIFQICQYISNVVQKMLVINAERNSDFSLYKEKSYMNLMDLFS